MTPHQTGEMPPAGIGIRGVTSGTMHGLWITTSQEPPRMTACHDYSVHTMIVSMLMVPKSGASSAFRGTLPPIPGFPESSADTSLPLDNALDLDVPGGRFSTTIQDPLVNGNAHHKNANHECRRPTSDIRCYRSGFIRWTQSHESLRQMIANPPHPIATEDDRVIPTRRLFCNVARTLFRNMLDTTGKIQESLLRVVFAQFPTGYKHCEATKSRRDQCRGKGWIYWSGLYW